MLFVEHQSMDGINPAELKMGIKHLVEPLKNIFLWSFIVDSVPVSEKEVRID